VKPRNVIPMHFATFPLLRGTPEQLQEAMTKRGSQAQLRVIKPGEKLDISGV
jgi:L-ascorbate metabolism protein UlaG (beta-lactamase superfamily)